MPFSRQTKVIGLCRGLLFDYGIGIVLAIVCAYFTYATWGVQRPSGRAAASQLANEIFSTVPGRQVVIVSGSSPMDREFAAALDRQLVAGQCKVVANLNGSPSVVAKALRDLPVADKPIDVLAASGSAANWSMWERLTTLAPSLGTARLVSPQDSFGSSFLRVDNLLNVVNQITVIAIVAVGMTIVVVSGGIDLSVGSLIALSAVLATRLIRDYGGGTESQTAWIVAGCVAAILVCAVIGAFSATMVTMFGVPPFIATLSMMLIASGAAYLMSDGQSINQLPESFTSLGRSSSYYVPHAVALMGVVYVAAHLTMAHTTFGRYVYAIGGNQEAARLSGVPIRRVLLIAYMLCGALAGVGGIVLASQLKSGSPTYGQMYELYVIAAVVVGGASLSGGEGRIFGTLLGALLIAVIQNGMNLTGVESYTQKVVLGALILVALLLDRLRTTLLNRTA